MLVGACSGSTDGSETTATSVAPPTTAAAPVGVIDASFLAEQVAKSWDSSRPGAVMVSVFDRDGGTVHASVGTDSNDAVPSPNDRFRIGSITKMITAMTVMSLVEEGTVDLDAPVADYISRVEIDDRITIRDLLQHSSGLPEYTFGDLYLRALAEEPARAWSPEEVIALAPSTTPEFEPGSAFAYSNTNYTVLGVVIEEVTERTYHEAVRERIFDPLGMSDSYLEGYEAGPPVFGGYTDIFGEIEPVDFDFTSIATNAWASGGVVSTGPDLHRMISAFFAGDILSPSSVAEMTNNTEWGFGFFAPEWTSATPLLGHDGRTVGSGTFLIHAPETGMTVFTVANADHLKVSPATGSVAEAIGVPGVQLDPGE